MNFWKMLGVVLLFAANSLHRDHGWHTLGLVVAGAGFCCYGGYCHGRLDAGKGLRAAAGAKT